MVNANLSEHLPHFIAKYFNGHFYDYMPIWYDTVGIVIVKAMIINSMMPYAGLCTALGVPYVTRAIDKRLGTTADGAHSCDKCKRDSKTPRTPTEDERERAD